MSGLIDRYCRFYSRWYLLAWDIRKREREREREGERERKREREREREKLRYCMKNIIRRKIVFIKNIIYIH